MKNLLKVWLIAAAPGVVPGWVFYPGLMAFAFAIGATLPAAGLAGIALFAARGRPDRGFRRAAVVALIAGCAFAGIAWYGMSA